MATFTNFSGTVRPLLTDKARHASFDEIPIISLTAPEPELIDSIRDACTRIGFFYVRDHGVSQPTIDQAFEYAKRFFAQKTEEKEKIHIRESKTMRGWDPVKEPKSVYEMGVDRNGTRKQDQKETFCWGYETALDPDFKGNDDKLCSDDNAMADDNVWPGSPAGFQSVIAEYYGEVLRLARRLIRVFAQALDLPADYFDPMVSRPGALGNILHYPPQAPTADLIGINAHSDFECFTILAQSPQSGLQVLNPEGEWILAPPVPGTFVVNIGDMLERWSNDIFVSTVHRVINITGEERYSIPVFFGPNYDTVVEPLKTCIAEGQTAKYGPILAGDYVYKRLEETYRKRQKTDQVAPEVTAY